MYTEFTNILSKIIVAEKKKKKLIGIFINSSGMKLLNFLWKKGFIFGYRKEGFKVIIYLKYYQNGSGFFFNFIYLGWTKVSLIKLKKISLLNNNDFFIIMTSKGLLTIKESVKAKEGGYLLGKF